MHHQREVFSPDVGTVHGLTSGSHERGGKGGEGPALQRKKLVRIKQNGQPRAERGSSVAGSGICTALLGGFGRETTTPRRGREQRRETPSSCKKRNITRVHDDVPVCFPPKTNVFDFAAEKEWKTF